MAVALALADSGFFIGLFDGSDVHHAVCREFLRGYRGRLITSWPVVTEALAMLDLDMQERMLEWLDRASRIGLMSIECTDAADLPGMLSLARKYKDQPMDFADASLYALALRLGVTRVLSVDRRDFAVYRLPGRRRFENLLYPT